MGGAKQVGAAGITVAGGVVQGAHPRHVHRAHAQRAGLHARVQDAGVQVIIPAVDLQQRVQFGMCQLIEADLAGRNMVVVDVITTARQQVAVCVENRRANRQ